MEREHRPNNLLSTCFSVFPTKLGYALTHGTLIIHLHASVRAKQTNKQTVACALWPYWDLTGRGRISADPIIPLGFFFFPLQLLKWCRGGHIHMRMLLFKKLSPYAEDPRYSIVAGTLWQTYLETFLNAQPHEKPHFTLQQETHVGM